MMVAAGLGIDGETLGDVFDVDDGSEVDVKPNECKVGCAVLLMLIT
jgi:hypothetical protein